MNIIIRPIKENEIPLLTDFLYEAIFLADTDQIPPRTIIQEPSLWRYINNFGKEKDDYCFDHIIPVSKGGSNDLSNLGITTPAANYSKSDLTVEEYLNLCKLVLEHHGYTVNKQ